MDTAQVIAILAGLTAFAGALLPLWRELQRTRKAVDAVAVAAATAARRSAVAIGEVHAIVNQQRTDMQRYQASLIAALQASGVDVPPDESLI